jgi:hypothetical protein
MKISVGLLLVLLSAISLAGCLEIRRNIGPCYGLGCPAFASSRKPTASNSTPAGDGQASTNHPNSPDAKQGHGLHAMLRKIKP